MEFFNKIKNWFYAHKTTLLAVLMMAALGFQYASYHAFNAAKNAAEAEKSGQRVVIDLQDPKWFSTSMADSEIVMQDEIKFSAVGKEVPEDIDLGELKDVTPQAKPEEIAKDDDDALTLEEKKKLLEEKPEVKALEKDKKDDKISALESKGTVSIIIINMGLKDDALKSAGRLSKEFTFAFTPYGQLSTTSSIQMAEDGYTILAELPMESMAKRDAAGKFNISSINSEKENAQNFEAILSIIPSAAGLLTPADEDFSERKDFDSILKLITDKKMGVIYRGKSPKKVREYAAIYGLDAQIPNIVIDNQASADDINAQLRALETMALESGSALGIARPYPITFEVLEKWQAGLAAKNLTLISAVEK